ncbi:uncharacterized protein ColSpa_04795 [Colletotrichum spaethianum]|uniref:Uncharacterized protein n=1 Tax=Colletotrichum spaethianum TaxID=700344 RepID=A0AA37P7M0_9PEZI|nr:uncharacterized protein ColSpa_04795 [Colletotrichum spaethianum]GKT44614.1 hypothetical protein ColSpa_04795 [Colletotrichum spaethianum]
MKFTTNPRRKATANKPSLAAFPLEILVEIAGYVARDCIVLPETQSDLQYTTNRGESQSYWPWLP